MPARSLDEILNVDSLVFLQGRCCGFLQFFLLVAEISETLEFTTLKVPQDL